MELETERLILREYVSEDWEAVLAYHSDPRYQRFYPMSDRSVDEAKDFIQMFLDHQKQQPRIKFQLVVTLKPGRQLIGNCGIRLDSPNAHQADLGYELASDYWGQGYATEAARAMLNYGFTNFNLHRIWSWCIADNLASARVLEKLGMKLEGRLRENEYFKDRWWDTLMYGILVSEWCGQDLTEP